jgi:hypothetical protein
MTMRARAITFSLLCLTLVAAAGLQAQEKKTLPERFTAVAIGTGGHDTLPVATPVEIVIERWSTDAERMKVLDALKKGQDAALDAIMKLRSVGYLRTPNSIRWDFTYIEQVPDKEGGRRILMAVDRDISFAEAVNLTPSSKYPFAFVELHLNKDGTGRGRLSRASSAWADPSGKYIVTENYESAPIEITQIKPRK